MAQAHGENCVMGNFIYFTLAIIVFFFFQALNFIVESSDLNDLFPFPSILDAGCPVLGLQLANVMFDVIIPLVFGSSL
jgi:hypothetical protein